MKISKAKLQEMRRAGYCDETVDFAATTQDSMRGSTERVEFMRKHIRDCQDCQYANLMKNAEEGVARRMGPRAHSAFMLGEDVTRMPGYSPDLLKEELFKLPIDEDFWEWVNRTAHRRDG